MKIAIPVIILIVLVGAALLFVVDFGESEIIINNPERESIVDIGPEREAANIYFLGDIMLGRYVETLRKQNGNQYPFEGMGDIFSNFDLTVGNLEGPIATDHAQTPDGSTVFSFEPGVAQLLFDNNIKVVSLANNHSLDQGIDGYEQTKQYLDDAGVSHFGLSDSISSGSTLSAEVNNHQIIFVGMNQITNEFDKERAVAIINDVKILERDAFVAVSIHWGEEYELESKGTQAIFAYQLIDAGADVIIGHHPHVVQEIEEYKGKMIFYSLGNFIFDQYFSDDVQQGLAVAMVLQDDEVTYYLQPIKSELSQPSLMNAEESKVFLESLSERSMVSLSEEIQNGRITSR